MIGIIFIAYNHENVYSLPITKSEEITKSLTYGEHPSESCSCVAFRLDDFSDIWLDKVKKQLVETFFQKKSPLSIGIVGDKFGDNEDLVNYVIEKIDDESFDLELANHGWQHEKFTELSLSEQALLIKKTNEKVEQIFGVKPDVFTVPFSRFNSITLAAIKLNDMSYYSSLLKKNPQTPYLLSNYELYHFPAGATTGEQHPPTTNFEGLPHETTLKDILRSVNKHGFSVVMMHPYEFTVIKNGTYSNEINWQQIMELELLIDSIRDNDLHIVTISKINDKLGPFLPIIPESSREIFKMWSNDSLPDSDFIELVHNLKKENVLTYPSLSAKISNEKHVPSWFKISVTWWLDEKTSNKDIINGIEYLLKEGILII